MHKIRVEYLPHTYLTLFYNYRKEDGYAHSTKKDRKSTRRVEINLTLAYPNNIMEKRLVYPIIASEYNDEDGHYFVGTSPNIKGMVTQGTSMADLALQAEDAIATMLDGETYPKPQDPSTWQLENNQRIIYIFVDMDKWLKKNTKTVRCTITVPEYLNDLAKENNVNVSRIATDALKAKLKA